MKWLRTLVLFDRGDMSSNPGLKQVHDSYVRSIQSITFPEGSGSLTLRRKFQRPDKQWDRNGVGFLKRRFFSHLVEIEGWQPEANFDLGEKMPPTALKLYPSGETYSEPVKSAFGAFDFITTTPDGKHIAIEWETGNISSSHRSMNKLAIALSTGKIHAGILIVPSRDLYEHLTDRIGNISELSGYLSMWKNLEDMVTEGLLAITVVEHDHLTSDQDFPYLPTGKDGNANTGQAKRQ